MKNKMILTGRIILMLTLGMVLMVGCGATNKDTGENNVETESEFEESKQTELDETETEDVTETETEESVSTEETEDTSMVTETEADTSMEEDGDKEDAGSTGNNSTSNTTQKPSDGNTTGSNTSGNTNAGTGNAGSNNTTAGNNNSSGTTSGENASTQTPAEPTEVVMYAVYDVDVHNSPWENSVVYNTIPKGQGIVVIEEYTDMYSPDEGVWYKVAFGTGYYGLPLYGYVPKDSLTTTGSGAMADTTVIPQESREAFDLINEERIKLGLEPAVWDVECAEIAQWRAAQVYELPYITEENAHAGFGEWQHSDFDNRWMVCECMAYGCGNASAAVSGWMNSEGHRDCLMSENRTKRAVYNCGGRWIAINSYGDI